MAGNNHFNFNPDAKNNFYKSNGNKKFRNDGNPNDQNKSFGNSEGHNKFYFLKEDGQQAAVNIPVETFASSLTNVPRIDKTYEYSSAACLPSLDSYGMFPFNECTSSGGMQGPPLESQLHQGYPPYFPPAPFFPYNAPGFSSFPPPPFDPSYPLISVDVSLPPPTLTGGENTKKSVQTWLNTRKTRKNFDESHKPTKKNNISISDYKRKVANLSISIRDLENLMTHLQVMSKSLDDKEWKSRQTKILNYKRLVQDAVDDLRAVPEEDILALLRRRQSKRIRQKKKRAEYRELRKENKALYQLEHSRIDLWLDKMKEQVETAKRDEDIKKQADYVLAEVFHKKSEAKRMLTLLTNLGKLRNARIQDRESKKEFVSKEAAAAFNTIIESLKKRWVDQINGYSVEEKGLRVMLSDAQVERSNVEITLSKEIHQQWLRILFGSNYYLSSTNNPHQISTVDQLVTIRESWDKFVLGEGESSVGSSIPNGWVLPVPPSSQQWALFLDK